MPYYFYRMFHSLKLLIIISLSMASNCFALVEVLPPYSVLPTLNGLNVAHFVTQDRVKITLYAVNHEKFAVLCDAEYQGGPDSEGSREQTVMPDKAVAFTFIYPKKTDRVLMQFICVKPEAETTHTTTTPHTATTLDATPSLTEPADSVELIENDLSITH